MTPGINEEPSIHRGWRWLQDHPRLTLVMAVLLCLGPFLGKPVHLDDPVYIWIARHILSNPLDPYGFAINWGETVQPVSEVMQNPPLACYYLALAGGLCGWSETALHTVFLLPAIAVVLGTYQLARRLCTQPGLAALATLVTPVFLVSGTTLMCDMLMLAFWIWAVVLWDRGLELDSPWWLAGAGVLMGLAELSKYFGFCLLPLLALYAWLRQRRAGWWLVGGLIPVAVLLVYQWATKQLYGHGLFTTAGRYSLATASESHLPFAPASVALLGFTGGGLAWPLFMTPLLWRRSHWITGAGLAALGAVLFHYAMGYDFARLSRAAPAAWAGLQMALWTLGGATLAGLALTSVRRDPTPAAWLLSGWVVGTMLFAGFLNWTLSGRTILPLAPAAAILLARRLDVLERSCTPSPVRWVRWAMLPAVFVALAVARADYVWAKAHRKAAELVLERFADFPAKVWHVGHWGFQFYMSAGRGLTLDFWQSRIGAGDLLVLPLNNTCVEPPQSAFGRQVNMLSVPGSSWVAIMNHETGAGFYSSVWGPLPFYVGRVPPEKFAIVQFPRPVNPPPRQ